MYSKGGILCSQGVTMGSHDAIMCSQTVMCSRGIMCFQDVIMCFQGVIICIQGFNMCSPCIPKVQRQEFPRCHHVFQKVLLCILKVLSFVS